MITSIGMLEFNSIARGIETADTMLKAGGVELIFAKAVCPGKFMVLVHGDIGAVKTSVAAGLEIGANYVVNNLILPRVHPTVVPAINGVVAIDDVEALGCIEYFDIVSSIIGADAAAKTGNVKLMEVRLGMGIAGKSFFTVCGDVSDVRSAVRAGLINTEERGGVISSCVIPSPDPALFRELL